MDNMMKVKLSSRFICFCDIDSNRARSTLPLGLDGQAHLSYCGPCRPFQFNAYGGERAKQRESRHKERDLALGKRTKTTVSINPQTSKEDFDGIPEDLVFEIIGRLPAKSVARFLLVSKLWTRIIRSRAFIASFPLGSSSQPRLLIAFGGLDRRVERRSRRWHPSNNLSYQVYGNYFLLNYEGNVAIPFQATRYTFDVWVLDQDAEKQEWLRILTFSIEPWMALFHYMLRVRGITRTGEFILVPRSYTCNEVYVVHYNPNTDSFRKIMVHVNAGSDSRLPGPEGTVFLDYVESERQFMISDTDTVFYHFPLIIVLAKLKQCNHSFGYYSRSI
ncbi:unnamed protein product [Thlaspi arvense]|uniref:F-box domain-containing protein n=1 Tax=Thlaspi arvense TaxID=13288 RepID=A0AAU9SVU2_THLAR|nr:unnamed protein product [Thlaspi arvense]